MRAKARFLLVGLLLLSCSSFLFGCKTDTPPSGVEVTKAPTVTVAPPSVTVTEVPGDEHPGGLIRVTYYTVNASNASIKSAMVIVGSRLEVTPKKLVDLVVDSLSDQSVILSVDDISVEDGNCIISFTDSIVTLAARGDHLEDAILDACAQSVLDNIPDCKSVMYRINGEAYVTSGHTFSKDHIYLGD